MQIHGIIQGRSDEPRSADITPSTTRRAHGPARDLDPAGPKADAGPPEGHHRASAGPPQGPRYLHLAAEGESAGGEDGLVQAVHISRGGAEGGGRGVEAGWRAKAGGAAELGGGAWAAGETGVREVSRPGRREETVERCWRITWTPGLVGGAPCCRRWTRWRTSPSSPPPWSLGPPGAAAPAPGTPSSGSWWLPPASSAPLSCSRARWGRRRRRW